MSGIIAFYAFLQQCKKCLTIEHSVSTFRTNSLAHLSYMMVVLLIFSFLVKISFTPNLPFNKEHLLRHMPVGHLIKFIVTYATPFWRDNGLSGEIVSFDDFKIVDKNGGTLLVYARMLCIFISSKLFFLEVQ